MSSGAFGTLLVKILNRYATDIAMGNPVGEDLIWLQVVHVHLADRRITGDEYAFADAFKVSTDLDEIKWCLCGAEDEDRLVAILARSAISARSRKW
jgi:hypothetical protein